MTSFIQDHTTVLARLSEWAIEASVEELRRYDQLTIALREALKNGADINELSAITGLTPIEIRRRSNGSLNVLSELETLAG